MKNRYSLLKNGIQICLFLLCSACLGPELIELNFVEVITEKPNANGLGNLVLSASLKWKPVEENDQLLDHGFIWAKNFAGGDTNFVIDQPGINTISLGVLRESKFMDTLTGLEPGQEVYAVKAYVRTKLGMVYGTLKNFAFNFVIQTDTITNTFNNEASVSAILYGLEALDGSIIDRGHILDKDSTNLYLDKAFFKKTSLKNSNDDGVFYSTFKNLAFNTRYFAKAYVVTEDGQIVYGKKILPVNITDGWLRVKDMPTKRAHAIGGAIANRAYVSLGCEDEECLELKFGTVTRTHQYDPLNNELGQWTEIQQFNGLPSIGAISFTLNNRLYVGLGNSGTNQYYNEIWAFDPSFNGGTWRFADSIPGVGRDGSVVFVIDDKAYIGTGGVIDPDQQEVFTNDFYEYNPNAPRGMRWRPIASLPAKALINGVEQNLGRKNAIAFSINGIGYVGTGTSLVGDLRDFWAFDPKLNRWVLSDALPGDPRRDALGFSINGKGYVGMGFLAENSTYLADLWEFNPTGASGKKWKSRTPLLGGGRSSAASFVIGNKAYVGGGRSITIKNNNLEFILYSDFWMYTPENN